MENIIASSEWEMSKSLAADFWLFYTLGMVDSVNAVPSNADKCMVALTKQWCFVLFIFVLSGNVTC